MSERPYLCLSDLLGQDLTSQEYFNTLSEDVRRKLYENDNVNSFEELQQQAAKFS